MAKQFKLDLSAKGIRELKKELTQYRHGGIHDFIKDTVDTLIDLSGDVAERNISSEFEPYIGVHREFSESSKYNYLYKARLDISNDVENISEWYNKTGKHQEVVSSVMMAEFGSGQYADPASYRGTFPHQKHAHQSKWYWEDEKGDKHSSHGTRPTRPRLKAEVLIENQYDKVAKEAFNRH